MSELNPYQSNAEQIYARNNREDFVEASLCDLAMFYELFPDARDSRIAAEDIVTICYKDKGVTRMLTGAVMNQNITKFQDLLSYLIDLNQRQTPTWSEILHQASQRLIKIADGSAFNKY